MFCTLILIVIIVTFLILPLIEKDKQISKKQNSVTSLLEECKKFNDSDKYHFSLHELDFALDGTVDKILLFKSLLQTLQGLRELQRRLTWIHKEYDRLTQEKEEETQNLYKLESNIRKRLQKRTVIYEYITSKRIITNPATPTENSEKSICAFKELTKAKQTNRDALSVLSSNEKSFQTIVEKLSRIIDEAIPSEKHENFDKDDVSSYLLLNRSIYPLFTDNIRPTQYNTFFSNISQFSSKKSLSWIAEEAKNNLKLLEYPDLENKKDRAQSLESIDAMDDSWNYGTASYDPRNTYGQPRGGNTGDYKSPIRKQNLLRKIMDTQKTQQFDEGSWQWVTGGHIQRSPPSHTHQRSDYSEYLQNTPKPHASPPVGVGYDRPMLHYDYAGRVTTPPPPTRDYYSDYNGYTHYTNPQQEDQYYTDAYGASYPQQPRPPPTMGKNRGSVRYLQTYNPPEPGYDGRNEGAQVFYRVGPPPRGSSQKFDDSNYYTVEDASGSESERYPTKIGNIYRKMKQKLQRTVGPVNQGPPPPPHQGQQHPGYPGPSYRNPNEPMSSVNLGDHRETPEQQQRFSTDELQEKSLSDSQIPECCRSMYQSFKSDQH